MTYEEYKLKQLEKELSEKEGHWIKILSIKGKEVTICSWETYEEMKKLGVIKNYEFRTD